MEGRNFVNIFISIILYIVSLIIFYIIIETAVRKGIDSSVIGRYLEKKHGMKEDQKSFFSNDLDD